jgi:hypothetical protein
VFQSHQRIVFIAPQGVGAQVPVRVVVGNQIGGFNYSYFPPKVTSLVPNTPDAQGEVVRIRGENFGRTPSTVAIVIGGLPCADADWASDSWSRNTPYLKCTSMPDVAGPKNLSVSVAGQSSFWNETSDLFVSECKKGFYGRAGEICDPCPAGANCTGGLADPYAQAGWYQFTVPSDTESAELNCAPAKRASRSNCSYLQPCEPAGACVGWSVCALGYTDYDMNEKFVGRCSQCVQFKYYRLAGECVECPKNPWLIAGLVIAGLVAMVIAGYIIRKMKISVGLASIGVDYFQVLALFANSKVPWPPLCKQVYRMMSIFNFNIELTAPECSFKFTYDQKWMAMEGLPLVIFLGLFIGYLCVLWYKVRRGPHTLPAVTLAAPPCSVITTPLSHPRARPPRFQSFITARGPAPLTNTAAAQVFIQKRTHKLHSHVSTLVSVAVTVMYFLYLFLTRAILDVFNCSPTDPFDGFTYLEVVFERCGMPGGIQLRLLPLAVTAFGVYSLGYPLTVAYLVFKHRESIYGDQILLAQFTGHSRKTNPLYWDVRKRYSKLYYQFKPRYYFWTLVILARKFALAVTALLFKKNPTFQLAVALLIMFISYSAQVMNRPYMSNSEKNEVVRIHQSEMNGKLDVTVNIGTDRRRFKRLALASLTDIDMQMFTKKSVEYFWNYNTVEAVLLGSNSVAPPPLPVRGSYTTAARPRPPPQDAGCW